MSKQILSILGGLGGAEGEEKEEGGGKAGVSRRK
jgi:hypothetical protein